MRTLLLRDDKDKVATSERCIDLTRQSLRLTLNRGGSTIRQQAQVLVAAEARGDGSSSLLKLSVAPQRIRLAKLGKSLVSVLVKAVKKDTAGFIMAGLIKCLAIL